MCSPTKHGAVLPGVDYVKDSDVMPANITYFTHFSGNFWWTRADYLAQAGAHHRVGLLRPGALPVHRQAADGVRVLHRLPGDTAREMKQRRNTREQ